MRVKRPRVSAFIDKSLPKQQIAATFPPKFMPFITERARWKVCYGGRASGKTESIAKALLLMGKQRPLRILCAREIMQSIKQSTHAVLASMIGILGLEAYYMVERDRIYGPPVDIIDPATQVLKKKRTEFFFIGLRDLSVSQIKSYHDIQICWVDECQDISKKSLRVLAPTIRRAQGSDPNDPGELWFSFNPTHEHDAVMDLIRDPPEDSIIIPMNWRDNPWFEQSGLRPMMEEAKRKNFDEYLHVWEGECLKYFEGQVYLNELKLADQEGRLTDVPYRSDAPCEVVFDIGGQGDATALWIFQIIGDYIHLIDYHEKVQSTVDYFLKWIEDKPYVVTKFWLPHDARQRHAGMPMSYEQLIRAKGKKVQVIPGGAGSVAEGINALRTLFPRLRIDRRKCARGLECLRNYRFEIEEVYQDGQKVFKSTPVHDQYSHGADSARYLAMAYRIARDTKFDTKKYHNPLPFRGEQSGWMTL